MSSKDDQIKKLAENLVAKGCCGSIQDGIRMASKMLNFDDEKMFNNELMKKEMGKFEGQSLVTVDMNSGSTAKTQAIQETVKKDEHISNSTQSNYNQNNNGATNMNNGQQSTNMFIQQMLDNVNKAEEEKKKAEAQAAPVEQSQPMMNTQNTVSFNSNNTTVSTTQEFDPNMSIFKQSFEICEEEVINDNENFFMSQNNFQVSSRTNSVQAPINRPAPQANVQTNQPNTDVDLSEIFKFKN